MNRKLTTVEEQMKIQVFSGLYELKQMQPYAPNGE
jgi:hypothetical protein